MFERHIMKLADLHHTRVVTPGETEAIEAAIALMRAAEPKDEAAEREHCEQLVRDESLSRPFDSVLDALVESPAEVFMRERAAARAEALGLRFADQVARAEADARVKELEAELKTMHEVRV